MNNVVYEKTMENIRKRLKIRIIKNKKDFVKYTSKPTCVRWNIYRKKLAKIHEKKTSLTLNKPLYDGLTVLEISKQEMYNFRYNFMIKKFNTKLLFTNTDSWCHEIQVKKIDKKVYKYKELFDLSNYPVDSQYYCSDNKKVVVKMKDEYAGKSISKL